MTHLHTIPEVAAQLRVNLSTIKRLVARGDIAVTQVGRLVRISSEALEEYLKDHTTRRGKTAADYRRGTACR